MRSRRNGSGGGRRYGTLGAAACALVLLGACRSAPPPPLPPPTVEVAAVERIDTGRELRLSGTIEAERSVALAFPVPGTVEEVLVEEGQAVRRGQVLARLSPAAFRHAVGIAAAQVERAEDAVRRLEPMHRNGTVPEVKWIEVRSGLDQARHALGLARKSLEDAVLRAPEDGVVARRHVEVGAVAAPGIPVFTLVKTQTMLAAAPVPEVEIARIRPGQPARVAVAALGIEATGTVREIGVVADPLTRTYRVKVALPNPSGALRVGMLADVFLPVEGAGPTLAVPREAVRVDEAGTPCVFVLGQGDTLERRAVETGGYVGERIAIARGLAEGERVVVSGTPMIADGVRVRVANAAAEHAR